MQEGVRATRTAYCGFGLCGDSAKAILHCMSDLQMHLPATDEVNVDDQTLAAIDRGVQDADAGRTVAADDVRKMIPKWLSKFASQKQR